MKQFISSMLVLLSLSSVNAYAGGSYTGKLQPFFYSNTLYLIPVESTILNKPVCASRKYVRLPDATGEAAFDAKYALILSAWFAKQELVITGTGSCTSEGDEIIKSILPK